MSDGDKTFRLKYVGARFDGPRLPVDVLSDLAAFRDLLVAFAKDEWRGVNPGRKRVPRGFDKSISFDLLRIEPGSAVPVINWSREIAQESFPDIADALESVVSSSFDDIASLLDNAGKGVYPVSLPSEHIRALNKLGSGLRDRERIEFPGTTGTDGNVIYLDVVRRKNLITGVRQTYQSRIDGVGRLISVLAPTSEVIGFIGVETEKYGVIQIPLDQDRVLEEFDSNLHSDVQFDLQVELDNTDAFKGVINVFDVVAIDAEVGASLTRCRERLKSLRTLRDGWHDGEGVVINSVSVETANSFLSKRPGLAKHYKIFPNDDGKVSFELEVSGWDITIDFGLDGGVSIYGVRAEDDGELDTKAFPSLDENFINVFDRLVG